MSNILIVLLSAGLGFWVAFAGCNKDKKKTEDDGIASVFDEVDDLPDCEKRNKKVVVYVSGEEKFYRCDGSEWLVADISSDGTTSVYQEDGTKLGTVFHHDYENVGITFSDGAKGFFRLSGKYVYSLCETGHCKYYVGSNLATLSVSGIGAHSYCFYQSTDCSNTCYVMAKPIKDSLFYSKAGWLKATGDEVVAPATIHLSSIWRHDLGDCVVTGSNNVTGFNDVYPVENSYSGFPEDLQYPFDGPLNFGD